MNKLALLSCVLCLTAAPVLAQRGGMRGGFGGGGRGGMSGGRGGFAGGQFGGGQVGGGHFGGGHCAGHGGVFVSRGFGHGFGHCGNFTRFDRFNFERRL